MSEPVRPDDSGLYDDQTLLDIVAERFARQPDPITQRDAAWVVSLAQKFLSGVDGPRAHPLKWVTCEKPCKHTLGCALGIDLTRSAETDALVNAMVDGGASLREIVTALSKREMTDAEFATAMYALGWFDRRVTEFSEGFDDGDDNA